MANLLMITGIGSAKDIASDKKGAFYYTLEEFHKHWDRIDIVTPRVNNPIKNIFGNVYLHSSPLPLIFHPILFIYKILRLNKKNHFDLMTVQEFPPFYNGIGARIVSIFTGIPYVLEIHHVPGYPKSSNLKEKIYLNLMKWFIKFDSSKARAIRVVNKKQTPEFLIKAGVPENKIVYIPSIYIDSEIFKPMNLPKEYDLIFVGRLVENKGINLFLETVKKLNCKAVVVGTGSLFRDIKLRVESWKLKIDMHGWAKDSKEVAELINKSKILVMPSYNEGGPRVVVEAMACGIPVLATPVGIVPDLFKNLPAGRQAASGGEIIAWNAEDIARKAIGLLNDQDKYLRYGRSGVEIAQQFEKKATIKNYAEELKKLII